MKFQVILPKSVQKEMDRLPDEIANRILMRLPALEANPRRPAVKKLKGRDAWRIRVGDYRVIFEIQPSLRDSCHFFYYPALKCRAIVDCRCAAQGRT
jgi:mRNA interferase RelE/StbE